MGVSTLGEELLLFFSFCIASTHGARIIVRCGTSAFFFVGTVLRYSSLEKGCMGARQRRSKK